MIAIDTNILLRYFTKVDEEQAKRAADVLLKKCSKKEPALVSSIVLVEFVWTLKSAYNYPRESISKALEALISSSEICFEYPDETRSAYKLYASGAADFSDALIGEIGKNKNCQTTYTIDKKASKLDSFTLA